MIRNEIYDHPRFKDVRLRVFDVLPSYKNNIVKFNVCWVLKRPGIYSPNWMFETLEVTTSNWEKFLADCKEFEGEL